VRIANRKGPEEGGGGTEEVNGGTEEREEVTELTPIRS